MAAFIYLLCALTSLACAVLLLRSYGRTHARVLLWSGLCFAGLTLNNVLLVIDRIVLPTAVDLFTVRLAVAFFALLLLLYGLIWEHD
jgi:Family of unknown function (DUF5985)